MRRSIPIMFVSLCMVTSLASASVTQMEVYPAAPESPALVIDLQGNVMGSGGDTRLPINTNYDNWTNPSSLLVGLFLAGGNEIADDLHMVNTGSGWVNDAGVNVANANCSLGNLTGGTGAMRWYDFTTAAYIGGISFNLPALNLAAGGSVRLNFGANTLTPFNIHLNSDAYMSLQMLTTTWSNPGCTIANAGYQLRAPINVGTSTDQLINVTTNTPFNFGGNPLANTGLYVKSDFTPEPATLGLLGLGGLTLIRRRR